MKYAIVIACALFAVSSAHAQSSKVKAKSSASSTKVKKSTATTVANPLPGGGHIKGFRVAISRPSVEIDIRASDGTSQEDFRAEADSSTGVAVGYINMPVKNWGWSSNLAWQNLSGNDNSATLFKVDGNVGFGINKFVHVKGGFNLSKFTRGQGLLALNPALGNQVSVGIQPTPVFGIDIAYVRSRQREDSYHFGDGIKGDLKLEQKYLEISAHRTF